MSQDPKERKIPAILIVVGLALYVLAALVRTGPGGAAATLVAAIIGGVVQTVILVGAAMIVATVLKVSFGDFPSAAIKFAAASLLAGGIAAMIPYGGIIGLFIFLGLVMWLFDLELTYAVVLAVVNWVISLIVGIILGAAIVSMR